MDGIGDRREPRPQCARLLGQTGRVPIGGKALDLERLTVAQQQIDGVLPDRAGRTENGDTPHPVVAGGEVIGRDHCHVTTLRPSIRVSSATTGITASKPSSLSRRPPWPGMRPLESFTPNLRLAKDSARSPNCSTIARPALRSTSGNAGEVPSHIAVAQPASAAHAAPPASPAQVLRGLQRGASRGPPAVLPIA